MSKLYINDLESIKNGKLVKFNFGNISNSKEISLQKLDNQIKDLRYIRNYILDTFKNDCKCEFDRLIGARIEEHKNIEFDPRILFLKDYLCLKVPTMFGDTTCLISDKGIESATFKTLELEKKVKILFPYIKGIFNLKNNTNILNNDFYDDVNIYNSKNEKVLNINGDGVFLPFDDYYDLDKYELQDLLKYYYENWNYILENINVPDEKHLDKYRTDASLQKALALYKGIK